MISQFVAVLVSCEFCIMSFDRNVRTIGPQASWTEIWHLWTVFVPRR